MTTYLIANVTDRCTEYLEYRASELAEALTMAERDGADHREVMAEDAAEMTDWPEEFERFPIHDWNHPTVCPQCGGGKPSDRRGLCADCSEAR